MVKEMSIMEEIEQHLSRKLNECGCGVVAYLRDKIRMGLAHNWVAPTIIDYQPASGLADEDQTHFYGEDSTRGVPGVLTYSFRTYAHTLTSLFLPEFDRLVCAHEVIGTIKAYISFRKYLPERRKTDFIRLSIVDTLRIDGAVERWQYRKTVPDPSALLYVHCDFKEPKEVVSYGAFRGALNTL